MGRRRWLLGILALLLLAGVGYAPLLRPGHTPWAPSSDLITYHLGAKSALYQALRAGEGPPLWRGDQLSGAPGLTNPQSLYAYPLHLLFYLLPPLSAFGPTLLLHMLLSAAGFSLLGGALGVGAGARALLAVCGLFSFKLILAAYAGWLAVLPSIALLPWLLWALLSLRQDPRPGWALGVAALAALVLLGGTPQLAYYLALLSLGPLLWHGARRLRAGAGAEARRLLVVLLGGGALGGALAAFQLLPMALEAPLISRGSASLGFFLGHEVRPAQLGTLLWPELFGSALDGSHEEQWEDSAYFGLVPLLLCGAGVVLGRRRDPVRLLAGGLVLSLLLAVLWSRDGLAARLAYGYVPGLRLFRCPGRLLFLAALFGVALAGVGLDELARRLPRRAAPWLLGAVLVLVAGEGVYWARRYLPVVPLEQALPPSGAAEVLAREPGPFRVAPVQRHTFNYAWAAPRGQQLTTGYDAYNLLHYQQYFWFLQKGRWEPPQASVWTDLTQVRRWDLLDALNVRYLLSPQPLPQSLQQPRLELVRELPEQPLLVFYEGLRRGPVYLYKNPGALGRAFFPAQALEVADEVAMAQALERHSLRDTAVVLTSERRLATASSSPAGAGVATVREAGPGRLVVEVETAAARYLVLSEVWHPGWEAKLDGAPLSLSLPLPIERADFALMAVWVPAGRHVVALRFVPLGFELGRGISAAALLLALLLAARLARPRGRPSRG